LSACPAGASVTCERTLETREPSCVSRAAKPLFIPVVHSPLGAVGHVAAPELPPRGGKARSHGTRGSVRAHLSREVRSEVEGHVAASELTSARRQGPRPRNMWQHRSPHQQGGKVQGRESCCSTGAHIGREARSRAAGYVVALEPTSAGRRGSELQDMWQRVDAHLAPCFDLKLVCGYPVCMVPTSTATSSCHCLAGTRR
jgi:hypothetical protein